MADINDNMSDDLSSHKVFGILGEQEKKEVMRGDLFGEHALKSKVIRIFLCSTFTDTQLERNVLMQEVYPRLKEYCRSLGLDFQIVDMRWGIRDEAVDEHLVSELCLQEIKICQEVSIGPQFVTFLGQKYGYRPLLAAILAHDFESIIPFVDDPAVKTTLQQWYKKDTNAVPAAYILQPISTYLPHCNDKTLEKTVSREKDCQSWNDLHHLMTNTLRRAARSAFKDRRRIQAFLSSVTEQEIVQGIFNCPGNPNDHCWWFKREIQDLRKNVRYDSTTAVYIDVIPGTKDVDADAHSLLARLKEDKIPAKYTGLDSSNIIPYAIKWKPGGVDPSQHEEHRQYIEQFQDDFLRVMKGAIVRAHHAYDLQAGDSLYREVLQHAKFARARQQLFQGREGILTTISDYLMSSCQCPLVVHGESGCGKTSVMAMAAANLQRTHSNCVIVLRFLGTTADSSSARLMLSSVCKQISKAYNEVSSQILESFKDLTTCFTEKLQLATEELPLYIFLDSLDQLLGENDDRQLSWLPKQLPSHVHIVVSTLPDRQYKCFPALQMMLNKQEQFVEVPRLSHSECNQVFQHWLQQSNRTLTAAQKEVVLRAFKQCPLALFLRLAFNEAINWKSYTQVVEASLPPNINTMIHRLFEHVEILHGTQLVSHALGFITAAKTGLSEAELEDMLSCDDEVLVDIYKYWMPPVRRLPPVTFSRIRHDLGKFLVERAVGNGSTALCWYHRQFHEAAVERYLGNVELRTQLHSAAADFYLGKWAGVKKLWLDTEEAYDRMVAHQPLVFGDEMNIQFNFRKMSELPWHLAQAGRFEELKMQLLTDLNWLQTKLRGTSMSAVMADFGYVVPTVSTTRFNSEDVCELRLILESLRLSGNAVAVNCDHLASQLVGRLMLLSADKNKSFICKLFDQAVKLDGPIILPILPCFPAPGGPLQTSLEGHTNFVSCLAIAKRLEQSGEREELIVMSGSWDRSVRVWDVDSGRTIELLTGHTDWVTDVAVAKNGLHGLSSSADGTLRQWNLLTADCIGVLCGHKGSVNAVVVTSDGYKAVSAGEDKQLKVWNVDPDSKTHGQLIFSLSGHLHHVTCLALGSDDNTVVSGSKDKSVWVWNLRLGNPVKTMEGHTGTVTSVAVFDEGSHCKIISSSDDRTICVWDMSTGSTVLTLTDHTDRVQAVAVTQSGLIVSGAVDKTVRVWELDSGQCIHVFEGHRGAICGLGVTDDSRLAISASTDDTLCVWDVEAQSPSYKLPSHKNAVTCITIDPSDQYVVSSSLDGTIQTYSLACNFQSVKKLGDHGKRIECIALSNDGQLLLSASSDHNLQLWDVKKGTKLRTYCKHADWVNTVAFTNDDRYCVSGSDDKTVVVWEVATGRAIRSLSGHKAAVKTVSSLHTKTCHWLVSGSSDRTVRMWDFQNGSELHVLSGHGSDVRYVTTAVVGPYGPVVVSASRDKTVKLWSLEMATCLKTFFGHQLPVNCTVLLKDGLHLLTGSSDKTIRLWSIESGASLASFYAESGVTCLSLAADQQTIVFGTNNGWISNAWLLLAGCNNLVPIPNLQQYIQVAKQPHSPQISSLVTSEESEQAVRHTKASPLILESEPPKEEAMPGHPQDRESTTFFPQPEDDRSKQHHSDEIRIPSPEEETEVCSGTTDPHVPPQVESQQSQTSSSCVLL